MNSFHAKNLLSEDPIPNRASALEMDKGSASYMKDDMAPKMNGPLEGNALGGKMAANQASGMSKEEAYKKAAQDLKK
jgi:hypothetical protein